MSAPSVVKDLVDRFNDHKETYHSGQYNETQLREEFLNPLFEALGWDIFNRKGYADAYKEVIHEDAIKIGGRTKAPDYCFRAGGGIRSFFVEAKKPSIDIGEAVSPAYQLRRYAWSAKLPVSILTDFEEFAVYDCRIRPDKNDKAATARIIYINYAEYLDRWDELFSLFSPEAIRRGSLEKLVTSKKIKKGTAEVDKAFLDEIESWRDELARNLALRNENLSQRDLNFAVQRIIDRIIFLRICEDRGVEPYGTLQTLQNAPNIYRRLAELFQRADDRYNSGLFHFTAEKDRAEPPDELTLTLAVDDKPLKEIFRDLYFPDSPYEFSVFPAEILGQVYEQFLGKVIRLTKGHQAKVEEKPEVRKAGGVYYTPAYIVDYIVRHTVGKLLEESRTVSKTVPQEGSRSVLKTDQEKGKTVYKTVLQEGSKTVYKTVLQAAKIRILDPACGSGSFLLGAYQYLLDWHRDRYLEDDPEKHARGRNPKLFRGRAGDWRLTSAERKRILLNNIHGVDIDPQAVEVTKLSLLLKVLEGESAETISNQLRLFHQRALPDLGNNIKCGNSLIGPDFYEGRQKNFLDDEEHYRINAFDWKAEFPEIFKAGGFDAVIGNPPYIFTRNQGIDEYQKTYFYANYHHQSTQLNTFGIFVEKCYKLLCQNGILGFITPNNWLTIDSFTPLRRFIIENTGNIKIVNILDRVFAEANVDTSILVLSKSIPTNITVSELEEANEVFSQKVNISNIKSPSYIIQLGLFKDSYGIETLKKIQHVSRPLSEFAKVSTGLKAYQTGKGKPTQTDKQKKERVFHATKKLNETYDKYLLGEDVRRYYLRWSGQYLSYGDWLAEPRKSVPFSGDRLLVRQIPSTLHYMVHAVFADKVFYNDINSMIVFSPISKLSLKFLLGLINSRLLSFWFLKTYDKLQRRIFPQFKVKELAQFPIRAIDFSNKADKRRHDRLVELVEAMLELHKKLAGVGRFSKQSKKDAGRFSKASQENEEGRFAKPSHTGHEKTVIERQIAATDRQIDQLVYELYGLTEAEIAIVEASK